MPDITYLYEEGAQPCGYCWGFTPEGGWDMENVDKYLPRGDGWVGLVPTHPECQRMVDDYMEEVSHDVV